MDYEDIGFGIFILIVLLITAFILAVALDQGINEPKASDDALNKCLERGFQSYDSYSRVIFNKEALGVKCNHINNKKEFDINSDDVLVGLN